MSGNRKNGEYMSIDLQKRNQIIIDAILKKEKKVCPGTIAAIGIGGSFANGDWYEKSDLDLLLLINDERGWQLAEAFIQEDLMVGHDIYCTTWESLEELVQFRSPHMAKLLHSEIVYCADTAYRERLEALRAAAKVAKPSLDTIRNILEDAKKHYTEAMLAESISQVRQQASGVLYYALDALMLINGCYYKKGVRRCYEELEALPVKPEHLIENIETVVRSKQTECIQQSLTKILQEIMTLLPKQEPERTENIQGTYEEMVSNWRNKMYLAAKEGDAYLSFVSMSGMAAMLYEDCGRTEYDVMAGYNPEDLQKTAENYDKILSEYHKEYDEQSIKTKIYPTVEAWAAEYTGGEQ